MPNLTKWWDEIDHFKPLEFDSPDLAGSGVRMDEQFIRMLDFARSESGIPYRVSSGYRTAPHNQKVGGAPKSAHLKGLAADISCHDPINRWYILSGLFQAGFRRIEVTPDHVHVDSMEDPAPVFLLKLGKEII